MAAGRMCQRDQPTDGGDDLTQRCGGTLGVVGSAQPVLMVFPAAHLHFGQVMVLVGMLDADIVGPG